MEKIHIVNISHMSKFYKLIKTTKSKKSVILKTLNKILSWNC